MKGLRLKWTRLHGEKKEKNDRGRKTIVKKKGDDRREILRKISRNVDCGMIDVKRIHRENTMNLKCN